MNKNVIFTKSLQVNFILMSAQFDSIFLVEELLATLDPMEEAEEEWGSGKYTVVPCDNSR